ncbi:MAG TPA: RsmG family class I SAM-dependent methyltransferase [Actinomycetota bacterium]|nr:RsmG family class I SAM-dependent methyltransferase [Actinomycetota bacterium]
MTERSREALLAYAGLVRAWAPRLDLISPSDLERFEQRHIHDSLRLLPLLRELPEGPCIDVGSGAGLPGIPLAIASDRHWRLLEPRKKRAGFLEEVVRELGLDCEVLPLRAEDAARDPGLASTHVLATARALAEPEEAVRLLGPLVASGGLSAVFVGANSAAPTGSELWQPGIAIVRASAASEGKRSEPS